MIKVVFSDSEKGLIKAAKNHWFVIKKFYTQRVMINNIYND